MNKFEDIGLNSQLLMAINRLGYEEPTEIHSKIIPHIMEGKDVIGESSTGSGKTLAFGCGVVNKVEEKQGLQALILAPTRELVDQVRKEIVKIALNKKLHITSIYGGVGMGPQIEELKRTNVVIATPGRLLDHYRRGNINLKYLKNPVDIKAEKYVDPSKLTQVYYDVNKNSRISLLLHLLDEKEGLAMIFCNTRKMVDFVTKNLRENKISTVAIHGGLTQNKRTNIIDQFNKGKFEVLVCTDVAARGLHIEDVSQVYNYEIPKDPNDYVHRSGRTARAGESGKVINLLCEYDHDNFGKVVNEYRNFNIEKIETPKFKRIFAVGTESFGKPQFRRGPRRNNGRGNGRPHYNNRGKR